MHFTNDVLTTQPFGSTNESGMIQHHNQWDPYVDNGGSTLAIAGKDFVVIASDTRQSDGYSINTRYDPKAFKLSNNTVLATTGYRADCNSMLKNVEYRIWKYEHDHGKMMSVEATAQMLSIMMYHRRFFIYYVFPILAGIDQDGKGAVYSYDPVGNVERVQFQAYGSSAALLQPLLDDQLGFKNRADMTAEEKKQTLPSLEKARSLVIDVFTGATERDIYTGDNLQIFIVTKDGVQLEEIPLKRD
ncbi:Proteasome subunit beta type-6 [Spiromyces aspiralis]|uniref:Proteasome subunit beta type-6 n=1 Tax=Spiromyces aspiralis TaxID=68401 RepID=A0ACC1HET1_9FUNG|nr:Proteasome subunit beta type-6 [Spiromyces aspiralis]